MRFPVTSAFCCFNCMEKKKVVDLSFFFPISIYWIPVVPRGSSPLFIANYEIRVRVFHIKPLGLKAFVFRIRRPLTTTPLQNTEICSEISIFLSIYSSSGSRTIKKQTFLLAVWEGLLYPLVPFLKAIVCL